MAEPEMNTGLFGADEAVAGSEDKGQSPKASASKPARQKKSKPASNSKLDIEQTQADTKSASNPQRPSKVKAVATKPPKAGSKPNREFPLTPLEDALKIPLAIKRKNGGRPLDTDLVATAYGLSRKNPKFYYATTASRDFGLTTGTRDTAKIELTELGHNLVYAPSPEEERKLKIEAFFKAEKFKQVYDYYQGSQLPEDQYLANTLEKEFKIAPVHHKEFAEVFKANCKYLGIEHGLGKSAHAASANGSADTLDTRSLGKPKGEFERTAFVIMPFSEKGKQERPKGYFDEVLKSVITPAANTAGFAVETARQEDSDIIHHTIINRLLNDDLVICDLTDHNPNVLFELGIRLAKEKPVVIIKSKDTGPVFDVDNMLRVYIYDQNLWKSTVEADVKALTDRISGTWENNETTVGYMRILTTSPLAK